MDIAMVAPGVFRVPEAAAEGLAEFATMTGLVTGVWVILAGFVLLVGWTAYDIGWR